MEPVVGGTRGAASQYVGDPDVKGLRGLALVFGLFKTSEYGSWIAITIFANQRGGVTEAAAVLVAQLVPATLLALGVGSLQNRFGSRAVLIWGLTGQVVGLTIVAATASTTGPVAITYSGAVLAAVCMVTTRPAVSTLLPTFTRDPSDVTRVHVLLGWLDGFATLVGPAIAALALVLASYRAAFLTFAVLSAIGAIVAYVLAPEHPIVEPDDEPPPKIVAALREIGHATGPRAALLLLAAQGLLIGCLDLLVVVVAGRTQGGGLAAAGWFGSAAGAGAMLGGTTCVLLIGRRLLWPWAVGSTVLAAATVACLAVTRTPWTAGVVFVAIGALAAMVLVAGRAMLQRLTGQRLLGHVFAVAESAESAMLLAGALLVPLLASLVGTEGTFMALGGVLLVVALVIARPLSTAERSVQGAYERVTLLRAAEPLAHLGAAALEGLARAAVPRSYPAGSVLMAEGDVGELFEVVVSGHVEISQDGSVLRRLGPGVGVGDLSLLYDTPRTATVTAVDPVQTLSLTREAFLVALTRQPPPASWESVARARAAQRDRPGAS